MRAHIFEEERELTADTDFWQTISQNLPFASQLVDVRYETNTSLELNENDQKAFEKAKAEIFDVDEFNQILRTWNKSRIDGDFIRRKPFELCLDQGFADRIPNVEHLPAVSFLSQNGCFVGDGIKRNTLRVNLVFSSRVPQVPLFYITHALNRKTGSGQRMGSFGK